MTVDDGLTPLSGVRVLVQTMCSQIKFRSIVLVEPMLVARCENDYERLRTKLVRFAHKRRDVWDDRKEAADCFRKAARWHPRILEIFVVGVP